MADTDILLRGTPTSATNELATISVASDAGTVIGDYILVVAAVDFKTSLTIANLTGVVNLAGAAGWTTLVTVDDGGTELFRMWLGKVTTNGAKSPVVSPSSSGSGNHMIVQVLNPQGGTITVDGTATTNIDDSSPFTHGSITVSGTKDLLLCGHAQVQFSGTDTNYGAAPSGMTELLELDHNEFSGVQVCYQNLTASGATGTRDQTSAPTSVSSGGGAGGMVALRNDATVASVPSKMLIAY
jgi:hypothetical protein